jgi:plastocyanin
VRLGWLALLLACAALFAAGCGGDDNDSGGGGGGGGSETSGGGGGGGSGGGASSASVEMKGIAFNPGSVTVDKGGTVTWTNEDNVGHDVTSKDFKSGDPGGIANGDTFKHTFDTAGTFDYVCTVHPGMKGTVVVK